MISTKPRLSYILLGIMLIVSGVLCMFLVLTEVLTIVNEHFADQPAASIILLSFFIWTSGLLMVSGIFISKSFTIDIDNRHITENFLMGQLKFRTSFEEIESIKHYFFYDDDYSSLRLTIFKKDGKIILIDNAQQHRFHQLYNELKKIIPENKSLEEAASYRPLRILLWSWLAVTIVVTLYILIQR